MTDRHIELDPIRATELLEKLRQALLAAGKSAADIAEERVEQRDRGDSAHQIAACEFAEMRMFFDMGVDMGDLPKESPSPEIMAAALEGKPSAVSIALVDRDGYCPSCFGHYYVEFAHMFRTQMRV